MNKSSLLLLSISLALFGIAVIAGHPPWGAVTGTAILLTAAGLAAGALTANSPSEDDYVEERRVAGQKVSNGLVTLSAAAILAVYVAGYHRTGSAADRFEAESSRRQAAAPAVATVVVPNPASSTVATPGSLLPSPAPARKTKAQSARLAAPKPAATSHTTPAPETAAGGSVAAATQPSAPEPAKPAVTYKDGTYLGWGSCRHGDLQASVVIEDGRIASTKIVQCLTRYPCSWIANLPGQVVTRQNPNVDYVSGATQSTDAFFEAVSSALAQARE
jgi:uncharacterized protein with FMN-binding domain